MKQSREHAGSHVHKKHDDVSTKLNPDTELQADDALWDQILKISSGNKDKKDKKDKKEKKDDVGTK